MIIKLYTQLRIEKDCFIFGKSYIYKLWIFEIRLNPQKVIMVQTEKNKYTPEEFMEKWL